MREEFKKKRELLELKISSIFDKLKIDLNSIQSITDDKEYNSRHDDIMKELQSHLDLDKSLYIDSYVKEICKDPDIEDYKIKNYYYREEIPQIYNFDNENLVSTSSKNYDNNNLFCPENKKKLCLKTFD